MCLPTAQPYAAQTLVDDTGIDGAHRLHRHCRTPVQVVSDGKGGWKLSDRAFVHRAEDAGTSVELECLLASDGLTAEDRVGQLPNTFAVVAVTVDAAREHARGAAWTPKPEDLSATYPAQRASNEYHGDIIGPINRGTSRQLAKTQVMLIDIPPDGTPFGHRKA